MRPSRSQLHFLAGLGLGVALCWAVGSKWRAASRQEAVTATPATPTRWLGGPGGHAGGRLPVTVEAATLRLKGLLAIGDPLDRSRALLAYLNRLGPADYRTHLECCARLGLPYSSEECSLLLAAWARCDLAAALEFAKDDRVALRAVLNEWSAHDPEAAHLWVTAHRGGEERDSLVSLVIPAISRSDSEKAMELVSSLPREDRWFVFHQLAAQSLHDGPDAARAWLDSVPDKLRSEATGQVATALAATDPATAVDWLRQDPQAARAADVVSIYRKWAGQDRQTAIDSMESLPSCYLAREALRGLTVQTLFTGDRSGALELMETHAGEVDDALVGVWLDAAMPGRPEQAMDEILQIGDPELRAAAYRKASRRWTDADPAAALGWEQRRTQPETARP